MFFKVASDISLAIHLVFVLFVIFGGIFVFKWKRMLFFHLPCLLWGCCIEFFGWICPLTPLENYFRHKAGGLVYDSGFTDRYIYPIIYPENLSTGLQTKLGLLLVIFNFIIYSAVLLSKRLNR